jgi:hypothetical protein
LRALKKEEACMCDAVAAIDGEGMEIGSVVTLLEGNDGSGGGVGNVDE